MTVLRDDWTIDPLTNRSNSSQQYLILVDSVKKVIKDCRSATSDEIGCFVVIDLVFYHGFVPQDADEGWAGIPGAVSQDVVELALKVGRMVRDAAYEIMDGHYGVARHIVSQLAHTRGFVPKAARPV